MSEVEFQPFQKVLVRMSHNMWKADYFSHSLYREDRPLITVSGYSFNLEDVISYEGNEPLLGTTDNPTQPVPDFRFGDKVEVWDDGSQKWRKAIFLKMHMPYYFCLLDSEATCCWKHCRHADW